jgi:hypothetical protein
MVKKITAAVILICMLSIVLSGCSFLYKNEQRDGEQAIAVVSYGGRVAYVTKSELNAVYNQSGYLYIYYYGWTAEETFEQLIDSLSYNALLGLKAKDYLTNEVSGITLTHSTVGNDKPTTAEKIAEMEEMLTKKYLKAAVEATNTTFRDAYDDFVEEINEENALANDTDDEEEDEEEEEETVEPRVQPTKEEEEEDEANIVVPDKFFTTIAAEIAAMPTATTEEKELKKVAVEALRRINKSLADTYRDYDYYYSNQLLTQVIERYKDEYKATLEDPTEAEILARYNEMLASNISSFATDGNYATALDSGDYEKVIYHPGYSVNDEKGYFYVMNILMKFSDEQSDMLAKFTDSEVANEDAIKVYRDYLATLIKVNVSNTEYDSEIGETEDNKMYDRENIAVDTILGEMEAELNAATTVAERIEIFKKWTYLVNDDPGAFTAISDGKPGYLVTPEGVKSSYVTEFTDLARSLSAVGEGAYGLNAGQLSYCVTDYGIHVMLVSYYPFDYANKAGQDPLLIMVDTENRNILTLNYVVDIVKGTTLREYITDILKEEKATNMQTVLNRQLYGENKDKIETFPKVYKDLLKEAQKLEKD